MSSLWRFLCPETLQSQRAFHSLRLPALRLGATAARIRTLNVVHVCVSSLRHYDQVFHTIVGTFTIEMVNVLGFLQQTSYRALHDETMLEDVARDHGVRMIRRENRDVSIAHNPPPGLSEIPFLPAVVMAGKVQAWIAGVAVCTRYVPLRDIRPAPTPAEAEPVSRIVRRWLHPLRSLDCALAFLALRKAELMARDIASRRPLLHTPNEILPAPTLANHALSIA